LETKKVHTKNKILLIVEDFDFIRNILGKEFQKHHYTIISVGSIDDALFVAQTDTPDTIIIDFEMRSNDPYRALSVLHNSLPDAYTILMNGNSKRSTEEKAKASGADRTLERAVNISTLDEIIQSAAAKDLVHSAAIQKISLP
jgi:DNA-binding NarL/FixJ family response regulator